MEVRVYYEDTDCGGVVYYANYLRYIERARTEYLRERGVDLVTLMERGIIFVVRSVQIGYKSSARYNDLLSIETELRLCRASLHFTHTIQRGKAAIVNAICELACVGRNGKPVRIPEDVNKSLSQ
ncbi:MAG: YbgC/FadM family acyl-CoA thioesterase [Deltaproteobacteria bacterium]|nr:YbgC/FadM family acyl-CoA thioesterase [Deltaproteobacteria bacterium]